jgi:tRNA/tmRNA/rRNA uracil-C5-methylase (TrmA/RlmC/RlmD family)
MDYVASKQRFGLRRGGKFNYIVDLHECHLIPPSAFAVARGLYEHATALGLPDYNLRTHEGFLRYVVVRRSPQDTLLLAVVTAAPDIDGVYAAAIEQVAQQTLDRHPEVAGFHWLVNDSLTDISFGESVRHWSAGELAMQVGPRTLSIGPNTFFQNNVYLLLPLLDDVASCVGTAGRVADLYGGVGTIALHIADSVQQITCVESVEESAALARSNAAANSAEHISVVASDVLAFLRDQPAGSFEVIVADPPRVGLGPEVCRELLRLRPDRLVYVSCNALTQLEDARALAAGYRLIQLRGYDMFPQTPHMEALAVFERRPPTADH